MEKEYMNSIRMNNLRKKDDNLIKDGENHHKWINKGLVYISIIDLGELDE